MSMPARKKSGTSEKGIQTIRGRKTHYNAATEREANVIGQRIADARHSCGLSLTEFSELLCQHGLTIQQKGINFWEKGTSVPNAYQLLAIVHALQIEDGINYFTAMPQPSSDLNEQGMEKLREYRQDLIASGRYRPKSIQQKQQHRHVTMRISFLPASAGTGSFLSDNNFENIEFPESVVPNNADFGVRVSGDSMEPVYHDGQIVWVQECETLQPGDVGIFMYDGEGYIKEYDEQEPDEESQEAFMDAFGVVHMQPVLVPFNKKYSPIPVSPHAVFKIAGKVVG